jgi:hypothetical protein
VVDKKASLGAKVNKWGEEKRKEEEKVGKGRRNR